MKARFTRPALLTLVVLLSTAAVGCKGKLKPERLCKDGCAVNADCDLLGGQSEADCRSECEEFLEDADRECRKSYRDYIDCMDKISCSETSTECFGEALGVFNDCEELFEEDCCGPNDVCDWAEDDICDCGGAYDWDSVDCQ